MRSLLLFIYLFFFSFSIFSKEVIKNDLKNHLIFSEDSIEYIDSQYQCKLKLSDNALAWQGSMIMERSDSVARKRYKIITSIDDRVEILTEGAYRFESHDKNQDTKSEDQLKCLYAILIRDYAKTLKNSYHFLRQSNQRRTQHISGPRLLSAIYNSKKFPDEHFKNLLAEYFKVKFEGVNSVYDLAKNEDLKLQEFIFSNFAEFKEAADKLVPADIITRLNLMHYEHTLKKSVVTSYLVSKLNFDNFLKSAIFIGEKNYLLSEIVRDGSHEWKIFLDCLSLRENNEMTDYCFNDPLFKDGFNNPSVSEEEKCFGVKEILSRYSPFSLTPNDFRRIESLRSLPNNCIKEEIEKRKFYSNKDKKYFTSWCVEHFHKDVCSKYFDSDWINESRVCSSDNECKISMNKNGSKLFYHNQKAKTNEIELYFKIGGTSSFVSIASPKYKNDLPPRCSNRKCSSYFLCDLKKNYELAYSVFNKSKSNQCETKEDCVVGQTMMLLYPLSKLKIGKLDYPGSVRMNDGTKVYKIYNSLLAELENQHSMQCMDIAYRDQFINLINELVKKKTDCVAHRCQFID